MLQQKIRICIVVPSLHCGGSERFASIVCNNINTNIFDVALVVLNGKDPFYDITNPAIKVHLLNIQKVRHSLFPLLKLTRNDNFDILFSISNHLNVFISIFHFLFSKKMKSIARESSIISINNKRLKYGKWYDRLIKLFYKNFDLIICQSRYMQNDLLLNYHLKENKTTVIYNPAETVSIPEFSANKKRKFFTVSRLSEEKGVARILISLALLPIEYNYYIIGDGPEKDNLQHLAKQLDLEDKVFFEGTKTNPYQYMSNADLFLFGSYFEGLPNVVIEAGMQGIPVVAYNSPGGISEIIKQGVNGFLVEEDTTGELFSKTILHALDHSFNREEITDMTRQKFGLKKIMAEVENCFLSVRK